MKALHQNQLYITIRLQYRSPQQRQNSASHPRSWRTLPSSLLALQFPDITNSRHCLNGGTRFTKVARVSCTPAFVATSSSRHLENFSSSLNVANWSSALWLTHLHFFGKNLLQQFSQLLPALAPTLVKFLPRHLFPWQVWSSSSSTSLQIQEKF